MDIRNSNDIVKDNYIEYITYTTKSRNYPDIVDGCKPSHRRCIEQVYNECPKHFVKATTAIGAIVKAHPHPSSIFGTLVPLTQQDAPFPIFDGQGNWGSKIPYSEPSAERYVEIKLSDLSSEIFESYNKYVDTIEGDLNNMEPEHLATFLPLALINGTYSIPTGMSTVDIPPLSASDLCDYAMSILKEKDLSYVPDTFIRPNLGKVQIKSKKSEWKSLLDTGSGRITIMPNIKILSDRKLEIVALPESKSIEHVNKILQAELDKDQIDVRDETTKSLSIIVEIRPYKKITIEPLAKRLVEKLTTMKSYRFIYYDNGQIVHCGMPTNMKYCLEYLIKCSKRWVTKSISDIKSKLKVYEIIEDLKKTKKIEQLYRKNSTESVEYIVTEYDVNESIAKDVLSKPISYLTKAHDSEIKVLKEQLKMYKSIDKDIYTYLYNRYSDLKKKINSTFSNNITTTFYTKRSTMNKLVS